MVDASEGMSRGNAAGPGGGLEPHAGFDGLHLPPASGLNKVLSRLPEEIAGPWTRFANALLTCGRIPAHLREVAILRTASRCGSDYIVGPHRVIGRHLGLTEQQIALALASPDPTAQISLASPAEAVIAATDEILATGVISDRVRRHLETAVGRDPAAELAMVVGQYVMVGFICKSARLAPEPGFS